MNRYDSDDPLTFIPMSSSGKHSCLSSALFLWLRTVKLMSFPSHSSLQYADRSRGKPQIYSFTGFFFYLFVVLKQEVDHIWTGGWNAKVSANAKKLG